MAVAPEDRIMMRRYRRSGAALVAIAAIALSCLHPRPRLIWNASASVPVGLYARSSESPLRLNAIVVVVPPNDLARYLSERDYLPIGVPMLKRVAALPGQVVCRAGPTITIDGSKAGDALVRDGAGRPLPVWHGCRVLAASDVFLMNQDAPSSFDGRYFGVLPMSVIAGKALPLWIPDSSR
jgi:conjugative transfer signal peptidase TraF